MCTNVISVYRVCFLQSLGLAHFVWITPLQCILCVGLIWELIEVNGFCALAALTLLGIIQAWLSQKMGPHRWVHTITHPFKEHISVSVCAVCCILYHTVYSMGVYMTVHVSMFVHV